MGVYGQIDYAITDQLELVARLRYSEGEKQANMPGFRVGPEPADDLPVFCCTFVEKEKWEEVTSKLGLNYHLNDDVMLYASYSQGYKAGGFNFGQADPYDPETVDALESGLKSRWLDNRVQLNLAAFYYDYQDKQEYQRITLPAGETFQLVNAAASTVSGLELEVQAQITSAFSVDASVGYLKAEYDTF